MALFHPRAARIDCEDCKKYLYDLEKGERKTFKSGPKHEEKPYERGNAPLQCKDCPKGSPENDCRLSDRNVQTVELYQQVRVMGATDDMRGDALLCRNLSVVDGLYREYERKRLAAGLVDEIIPWLPWIKAKG